MHMHAFKLCSACYMHDVAQVYHQVSLNIANHWTVPQLVDIKIQVTTNL